MLESAIKTPEVYVDAVIFQLIDNELAVLLTQREQAPFKGKWALPGGRDPISETTFQAMERWLSQKTGVPLKKLGYVEQLYTFDTVIGNPEGPAVSVAYAGLGRNIAPKATALSRKSQFFPIEHLPDLAFDHNEVIAYAHQRLQAKITYTNAVFALLPPLFTLSHLQAAYEAILGHGLDKRNFRKKFLGLELIQSTSESYMDGAHRPARLYKFNKPSLEYLLRSFD